MAFIVSSNVTTSTNDLTNICSLYQHPVTIHSTTHAYINLHKHALFDLVVSLENKHELNKRYFYTDEKFHHFLADRAQPSLNVSCYLSIDKKLAFYSSVVILLDIVYLHSPSHLISKNETKLTS